MRILVRLVLNWKFWDIISRCCATLSGIGCSCSVMDLNKAVPPWRRQSWRKRYSNMMRMNNQAKLAAGACWEHMAEQMSKFLYWSATTVTTASCAQLPFLWAILIRARGKLSCATLVTFAFGTYIFYRKSHGGTFFENMSYQRVFWKNTSYRRIFSYTCTQPQTFGK